MRTNLLAAAFAALLSLPAFAQVELKISFPWAAPPPLVVVEPGIQVVPDYSEEVFFVDGWYWTRHDGRWCHARDYRAGWAYVNAPPPALVRLPPGKYRHWKMQKAMMKAEKRHEDKRRDRRDEGQRIAAPPPARVAPPPPARVAAPPPAVHGATPVERARGRGK